MPMPILDVLCPGDIVHATYRAGARLIAATTFTVHGADISRSIFFSLVMRFADRGGRFAAMVVSVLARFFMAVRFAVMAVCISGVATTGG